VKRNGEEGQVVDVTVEILKGIREEIRELRKDTNARFEALETATTRLETATIQGFEGVHARLEITNRRLDHLIDFAGERYRDHEERLRRLEQTVHGE
jgi:hypothetical protein